jgi:uncharacterized protein (DUF2141 family)
MGLIIGLIGIAMIVGRPQAAADVGTLTVTLVGFANDRGSAMVALSTEKGFMVPKGWIRAQSVKIQNGQAICVFTDVPYGRYAIQAYHDENGNKRLDTGTFGIPTEPYGFSNDARGTFGPPRYDDAEFRVVGPTTTLTVRIR